MTIKFNIDYHTNWGESVYIVGNCHELGNDDESSAIKLNMDAISNWSITVDIPVIPAEGLKYSYFIRHDNGFTRHEWGKHSLPAVRHGIKTIKMIDHWLDQPSDKPFFSSAFTDCICKRHARDGQTTIEGGSLCIRVAAPMIRQNCRLAICGSNDELGNWDPEMAVKMNDHNFPEWSIILPLKAFTAPVDYKFLIIDCDTNKPVMWENRNNRHMALKPDSINESIIVSGLHFENTYDPWHGAGVAIPVFSLRSNDDFGCGDFFDLMKMADWCHATGQRFIQILPINDTTMTHTWTDSYPYNANSTFALHPMYLRLQAMGRLIDDERQAYYDNLALELNKLPEVDYERVNRGKIEFTRELYAQDHDHIINDPEFKAFVKRNASWLTPYAAFCVLRDKFNTADMSKWGDYAVYDQKAVDAFVNDNQYDITYVYFIQYHLDKQMLHVREYAHNLGIAIKGDIPIGISRTSVDAWLSPRLFNLDCSAGAPPDDFSVLGQNWNLPTYNWQQMSLDGYAWWKSRFRKMSEYFDAYRIDHVLGFFRIWQIPTDAIHGLLGAFNPALPFTPDELRNNYDFWINVDLQTKPYIFDHILGNYFGRYSEDARFYFLESIGNGRYRLKEEFSTQRKVADHFATLPDDERNRQLCAGLLSAIDDVLFIEDPYQKGKYHPRISAQYTNIYNSLTDYEKWCFNRLYDDFYYHRHNDFWYGKAMEKLPPLIDATDMLTCAEDLGMIPDCVPAVMHQLEILSLEIQRTPKDPHLQFGDTRRYPYYSVCTTSTHDMPGIRQWWEENRDTTQSYYNNVLHEAGAAPFYAEPWICEKIISNHLTSPSMLCILPLQDWLSTDATLRRNDPREEQINIPAISKHYWRYRMHLNIETLIESTDFNKHLKSMITQSGR
ncbi:MAG: 4-alpha-glucanotransferase [Muribaculaceae bacterium]|nr:4-alpha-glucanotransferase [Muribaculaceae bacterium]